MSNYLTQYPEHYREEHYVKNMVPYCNDIMMIQVMEDIYVFTGEDSQHLHLHQDTDYIWWIGYLYFRFEIEDKDYMSWNVQDYHRAAQLCHYADKLIDAPTLIRLCGIKQAHNTIPDDWETVKGRYIKECNELS
jgi:hypothetical protein